MRSNQHDRKTKKAIQRKLHENTPEFKAKRAAYARAWREKHPGYSSRYTIAWARKHQDRNKELKIKSNQKRKNELRKAGVCGWNIMKKYHLTRDQYDAILLKQCGLCAICKQPPENGIMLFVDHDHQCCPKLPSCGKCVRGLLHGKCNTALGMLKDDPTVLRLAAEYLESFRTEE